jgi:hypothetical protein
LLTTDLAEKRLELLKEMVPGITRVVVLHEQNFAPGDIEVKQLVAAANLLKLQVQAVGAAPPDPAIFETALPEIVDHREHSL